MMTEHQINTASNNTITVLMIELIHHADVLINAVNILRQSEHITLVLFVSERVYNEAQLAKLNEPAISVVVQQKQQSVKDFLHQNHTYIESSDIIYFNTIEKYFRVFAQYPFGKPTIIRIHNIHADFIPWSSLHGSIKSFPALCSYIIRRVCLQRRWFYKKVFLQKSAGVMLPNTVMTDYLKSLHVFPEEKILAPVLPFYYLPESLVKPVDKQRVVMAVTGSVDTNRKDFEQLYQALKKAVNEFNCPVELKLLGKPKADTGLEIIEKFKSLQSSQFTLDYSLQFIDAEQFDKKLQEVDFLIAPIRQQTVYKVHNEVYGKSKMSGVEKDIVTHLKPSIIIDSYNLPTDLATVCSSYSNTKNLQEVLVTWVNQRVFEDKQSAFANIQSYREPYILKNIESFFKQLVITAKS